VASPTPVPATPPPAILGRSIEPVSLNPDPLLGFLLVCRKKTKCQLRKTKTYFSGPPNWHDTKRKLRDT
jgi:hypothetical protein